MTRRRASTAAVGVDVPAVVLVGGAALYGVGVGAAWRDAGWFAAVGLVVAVETARAALPEVWDALCVAAGRAVEAVHRALGASGAIGEAVGRAPTRSALGRNETVAAVAGVGAFAVAVVWMWPGPSSLGAGIALLVAAAALEQLAWSETVWRVSLYVWWVGMVVGVARP